MLSDVGGWGVSECSGRPISFFIIKENWICTNILLIIDKKSYFEH